MSSPRSTSTQGRSTPEAYPKAKVRQEAPSPAAPSRGRLPKDYGKVLGTIKDRIRQARSRVAMVANCGMLTLYWDVGRVILERQGKAGWGAKIVDRLSMDLRKEFPDMRGFSPRNLKYMRAFSAAWPDPQIVQGPLAQITWYHNIALLEKLGTAEERLWYAGEAAKHGWTQPALILQIERGARRRQGRAQNNFHAALPPQESSMAAQVFKDPYVFDFTGTADLRNEREIEQTLMDHMQKFLLELGAGFAFVGRQVRLSIGNSDLYVDLLFYHLRLRCYVVVELKAVAFESAFVGQMNLYLSAADELLRGTEDRPTIGLLLCRSRDRLIVEYALRGLCKPIGVADWETELVSHLPEGLKGSLPTVEDIEAELKSVEAR